MPHFLTGSTGYLGRVLVRHLSELPQVTGLTCIARTPPPDPLPPRTRFIPMDVRADNLADLMAGHDAIIHAACVVLWPASMSVAERDDINHRGTRNVAQAALRNRVTRFIHASSMAAYDPLLARGKSMVPEEFPLGPGDSRFYYWNSKARNERLLDRILGDSGIILTHLRPIYIMGPLNRPAVQRYRSEAVNLCGHDPRRQFVHEDDVAAAFIRALSIPMPGAYNVVPDDFMRMSEIWKFLGARSVQSAPLWLARFVTWARWRFLGSPIHPSWVEDLLVDFTGSNAKLKSTGWHPSHSTLETLRASL